MQQAIRLKVARVRAGLKQSELADILGIDRTLVSRYEKARRPITPTRIATWTRVCKLVAQRRAT